MTEFSEEYAENRQNEKFLSEKERVFEVI